jgi:hypothetical protein
MNSAQRIDIEVLVGNRRRLVMRRLGGRVDHQPGPLPLEQVTHTLPVADVQIEVPVIPQLLLQAADNGAGRPLGTEERGPHIVIDANHFPSLLAQQARAFGADQTAGTCDESLHKKRVRLNLSILAR